MLDTKQQKKVKYLLFTSLYFSEGIQLSITTVLTPLFLLNENISPSLTTMAASLVMIPWAIKFFFGWIVDYHTKINKKQYTLFGGVSSAIFLIILGVINPSSNIIIFILILFLAQCGIGILDVSMDAWAITETKKRERGKINGSMMSGFFIGAAVGSATLPYVAEQNGFSHAFVIAGFIILSTMIAPLITKKPINQPRQKKLTKVVIREFHKKNTLSLAILLPIISINSGIITIAAPIFMNLDLNFNLTNIGLIATVFTIFRVFGSLIAGSISDIISRNKTLIFIVIGTILFSASLIFVNNWITMTIIYAILGFLNGGLFTVLLASSMDITNKKIGAFQFSILISLMNAGELSGEFITGPLITVLGFDRMFLFSAWILGPSLLFVYAMARKKYLKP